MSSDDSLQSNVSNVREPPICSSPFFHTPPTAQPGSLAILHLKRDSLFPVVLREHADDGYAEGAVTNTRFGSFPHSTLLGIEWGSQVRASKIDTGSRGRKAQRVSQHDGFQKDVNEGSTTALPTDNKHESSKKRTKFEASSLTSDEPPSKISKVSADRANGITTPVATPTDAGSGFIHILPPTPESWTSSLDHRTQVVYTPDYSYVLQRLNVRPGDTIIEAGAGSGSFTHAAARAIFNGYPARRAEKQTKQYGRVCSFEYHKPRIERLQQELNEQGLEDVVTLTHRDVYNDGFLLPADKGTAKSPNANAIFLDLPAPWQALKHLTRANKPSPLNPDTPVHLCSFSPCIEQVISTVSHLGKAGWISIEMVEVAHHRIDVRREQVGLRHEGLRGVNPSPANVEESLFRLREVEAKLNIFHTNKSRDLDNKQTIQSKQERLDQIRANARTRKPYKEGNLVHRAEPEIKTHTSYLVFAILPRQWTDAHERTCDEHWGKNVAAHASTPSDEVTASDIQIV